MASTNPTKTLTLLIILLIILLLSHLALSSDPDPNPTTTTTITHSRSAALLRHLIGILLGSLFGFFLAVLLSLLFRLALLFLHRTPILSGPVVFPPSPITPKSLSLALSAPLPPIAASYSLLTLNNNGNILILAVKIILHPNPNPNPASSSPTTTLKKRRAQRELEALANAKHRNIMSLRAYLRDDDTTDDRLALVYDYVPGGSLDDAMKRVRARQLVLGWDARHRIAVGVVKGLRYLHFECTPRILHYSLKPSNVLIDEGFEPRLADCGLATRLVGGHPNAAAAAAAADAAGGCYVAPECLQSCRYTDKSNVFSFGVILGELLTGRDPSDPMMFAGESSSGRGSLGRWLRQLQQAGEAREALDKGILGEDQEGEEEEMLMAIRIALVCLSDLPADRPSSDELVAMLTQLHSF